MSYIPHTNEEITSMLDAIGIKHVDELFASIPKNVRPKRFDIPASLSELEVKSYFRQLANKNATDLISFVGGGFYDHFIPAALDALAARSEFYTAYTPYQPEASQGTLQAIYEYQTSICRLTGLEAANASLYDGGTALIEASLMALRITGRNKIIIDGGVSPIYRKMLISYTRNLSIELIDIPVSHGQSNREKLLQYLDDSTAAIILQNPNFFGVIDDHSDISKKAHSVGALTIQSVYPIAMALIKPPGEQDIDIATGEGQSLGMPLSFGGPYLGFMATKKKYIRKMPGRIVGMTNDTGGKRGFVLTLQTREQHIRREKATSNICSNQSLCALKASIYLSLLGENGLKEVAKLCIDKANYAAKRISAIPWVKVMQSSPTFNEFTVNLGRDAGDVVGLMVEKGFAAGFPLGRYYPGMEEYLLVAVTEKRTKAEIGHMAEALEDVLNS